MITDHPIVPATAKIKLSTDALVANWRALGRLSGGASAGAAVKADAYGLGVRAVVERLQTAGCKDFFVANWQEVTEIADIVSADTSISVLNGVRTADMAFAASSNAKPVLNSLEQVSRWQDTGRLCDVMIDSGMNRLGIELSDLNQVADSELDIDLVMSHLASADEDSQQNADQLQAFSQGSAKINGRRRSLANSAGIALGDDFHLDCTRPGLSLYGGIQRQELEGVIRQVAFPQSEIIQMRSLKIGDRVGYNAKYIADRPHDIAILAMGYADGYLTGFSNSGCFLQNGARLPVLGRVSMDLVAIDSSAALDLTEGDWVDCEYDLRTASAQSGLSQYELITGLGQRLPREWG